MKYLFLSFPHVKIAIVDFLMPRRAKREKESHATILWPLSFWLSSLGITVRRIREWQLAGLSRGHPPHTVDAPWFRDCETACHLLGAPSLGARSFIRRVWIRENRESAEYRLLSMSSESIIRPSRNVKLSLIVDIVRYRHVREFTLSFLDVQVKNKTVINY